MKGQTLPRIEAKSLDFPAMITHLTPPFFLSDFKLCVRVCGQDRMFMCTDDMKAKIRVD